MLGIENLIVSCEEKYWIGSNIRWHNVGVVIKRIFFNWDSVVLLGVSSSLFIVHLLALLVFKSVSLNLQLLLRARAIVCFYRSRNKVTTKWKRVFWRLYCRNTVRTKSVRLPQTTSRSSNSLKIILTAPKSLRGESEFVTILGSIFKKPVYKSRCW